MCSCYLLRIDARNITVVKTHHQTTAGWKSEGVSCPLKLLLYCHTVILLVGIYLGGDQTLTQRFVNKPVFYLSIIYQMNHLNNIWKQYKCLGLEHYFFLKFHCNSMSWYVLPNYNRILHTEVKACKASTPRDWSKRITNSSVGTLARSCLKIKKLKKCVLTTS